MKKINYIFLAIFFTALVITGCSDDQQITKVVNEFVEAYNNRDAQKCLSLCSMGESSKADQLDSSIFNGMQHYFDIYPSTPTLSSVQITDISYWQGLTVALIDFYSVDYDTGVSYSVYASPRNLTASGTDSTYSAEFALVETNPGFLGFYSTWKVLDMKGIPGVGFGIFFN